MRELQALRVDWWEAEIPARTRPQAAGASRPAAQICEHHGWSTTEPQGRLLTVKLRGRAEAPANPQVHHGPLQRLLEGAPTTALIQKCPHLDEGASGPAIP